MVLRKQCNFTNKKLFTFLGLRPYFKLLFFSASLSCSTVLLSHEGDVTISAFPLYNSPVDAITHLPVQCLSSRITSSHEQVYKPCILSVTVLFQKFAQLRCEPKTSGTGCNSKSGHVSVPVEIVGVFVCLPRIGVRRWEDTARIRLFRGLDGASGKRIC